MSLHFDLAVTEIPVELGERKYVLREASEGAACQFRNAITKAAKMSDGKVVGIENIGDVEPLLVSLCMFEVLPDGGVKNVGVPIQVVRGWPARVVKQLFAKVKEISELDEKGAKIDEPLIAEARKELAVKYHPDRGGDTATMAGINAALDYLDELAKKRWAEETAKNGRTATPDISA